MNQDSYKTFGRDKYEAVHRVKPEYNSIRLDSFILHYMPTLSREHIKRKIASGEIFIKERSAKHKPSTKVFTGDIIHIVTHNKDDFNSEIWKGVKLEQVDPEVIFEDENIIVCNKPPFMITHPAGKHLFNCATVFFGDIHKKVIHSIHRLDRETSGVLLLGKSSEAAQKLSQQFEDNIVKKCYFLIALEKPGANQFPYTANERLGQKNTPPEGMMHAFHQESLKGKHAQTHFELIHRENNIVLALAFPKTGRQHQIRAHAAFHGHPLLGDKIYNGDPHIFTRFKDNILTEADYITLQIPRQALHAVSIRINYQGKPTYFSSPLPHDLKNWIVNNLKLELRDLEDMITDKLANTFY